MNAPEPTAAKPRTFAEIYCAREGVAPADLPAVLFSRTLFPHARLVAWLVRRVDHRFFLADYEFVEDVCHLRSLQDFSLTLGSYVEHPSNGGLLRRRFHIRVSARRMFVLVRDTFSPPGKSARPRATRNTFEPFGEGR